MRFQKTILRAAAACALLAGGCGAVEVQLPTPAQAPSLVSYSVPPLWCPDMPTGIGSLEPQGSSLIRLDEASPAFLETGRGQFDPSGALSLIRDIGLQSRTLMAHQDLQLGLQSLNQLAALSDHPVPTAARAGRAAAVVLQLVTAESMEGLAAQSPPHYGVLQTLDPADVRGLRATAALLQGQRAGNPGLLAQFSQAVRTLQRLSSAGLLDETAAQLSQLADNGSQFWAPDISPTFDPGRDPAREALAASFLPTSREKVLRALRDVELPPVLAYKAASLALREDLAGAFSEIGAAQKVSGDFYKIAGQNIIHAAMSPYAREASDLRYSPPNGNPTSGDYTSLQRLMQQLDTEYSELSPPARMKKFAVTTTARTSYGNGHAWLGIRAQLAPGQEPVTIALHVRLLGQRTRNQKDVLGAIGVNALFGAYYHLGDIQEFARGLGDALSPDDFEIDYLSITGSDGRELAGREGNLELLRLGLARQILLDPDGRPVAPAQAAQDDQGGRWSLMWKGGPLASILSPFAAAHPPQEEPVLVQVATPGDRRAYGVRSWVFITNDPARAADDLSEKLYPAQRGKRQPPVISSSSPDYRNIVDHKAKKLNVEHWVKGAFSDIGGYQSVVTRFFEASNSHTVFGTFSYPNAQSARARYGPQGSLSDLQYLRRQLDVEFPTLGDHRTHSKFGVERAHNQFALATRADERDGVLRGYVGLRLEDEPRGPVSDVVISFEFYGGTWQERRNALAALGVNLIYAAHTRVHPQAAFLASLREGMGGMANTLRIVETTGEQGQRLGL